MAMRLVQIEGVFKATTRNWFKPELAFFLSLQNSVVIPAEQHFEFNSV
jgi:hypothetical protein